MNTSKLADVGVVESRVVVEVENRVGALVRSRHVKRRHRMPQHSLALQPVVEELAGQAEVHGEAEAIVEFEQQPLGPPASRSESGSLEFAGSQSRRPEHDPFQPYFELSQHPAGQGVFDMPAHRFYFRKLRHCPSVQLCTDLRGEAYQMFDIRFTCHTAPLSLRGNRIRDVRVEHQVDTHARPIARCAYQQDRG